MEGTSQATTAQPGAEHATATFNLVAYARERRYRVRNLHDGGAVPPARYRKPKGERPAAQAGYVGQDDRVDTLVGYNGYIADEGESGRLGICLFYRSAKGVNRTRPRLATIGGTVTQEGDTEITGAIPLASIDEALALIRVSKLRPGSPDWQKRPGTERALALESSE